MRKHVLTRSILPSIKTKEYIYKVKARLENEKLREWGSSFSVTSRVCDNHIDPMNRYNEDCSLYLPVFCNKSLTVGCFFSVFGSSHSDSRIH